ncbi:ECF transporter S component [Streptococcus entericus]|uniref:ECF transporter S component n=1 Tax=Streptococcus entericus TaxID=155680 RepID=UPI00037F345F|nr:ECF transporter S component [Streptococcus entericus]
MTKTKIKTLTLLAIITALTLVLGKVFQFSMALGFFTLLDVGIYFAAFYLGKKEGATVGALAGFLIDLLSGYPQYMLVSLVAHGAQGYLAGWTGKKRLLGLILSVLVMVATYFIAETVMTNVGTALTTVVGNSLQSLVGMALGYALVQLMKRVGN